MSAAKALALAWGSPVRRVNHLEAHLYAALARQPDCATPLVVLLVSGGHTMVVAVDGPGHYRVLGETVDDAAGEAFDKVARFLGLGYPGGPVIDRLAREGRPDGDPFPRAMAGEPRLVVLRAQDRGACRRARPTPRSDVADIAASFQEAVVDQLIEKLGSRPTPSTPPTLVIGGGVAANSRLRSRRRAPLATRPAGPRSCPRRPSAPTTRR